MLEIFSISCSLRYKIKNYSHVILFSFHNIVTHILKFLGQVPVIKGHNGFNVVRFKLCYQVFVKLNALVVFRWHSSIWQNTAPGDRKSVILHLEPKTNRQENNEFCSVNDFQHWYISKNKSLSKQNAKIYSAKEVWNVSFTCSTM